MTLDVRRVQVWRGELPDPSGAPPAKLEALTAAGAELALVFTRLNPHKPGTAVLFLAPVTGPEQMQAARAAGLGPALDVFMLAVQGPDRRGLGIELMSKLAIAGINLRGFALIHTPPGF